MPLENLTKFFQRQNGKTVRYLRASILGHYWYCAVQAWLQASGIRSPSNEAMEIGKRVHDEISKARSLSAWEKEFNDFIAKFQVEKSIDIGEGSTGMDTKENMVFQRAWYDGETVIGHVVTSGVDDFRVSPERDITFIEYKTSAQKVIDYYKLAPASFQLRVYMWIFEPILKIGGYKTSHGEIVYLTRKGDPIGKHDIVDYDATSTETEIERILKQFRDPSTLIPPSKFKCFRCPDVYKSKCPFQGGHQDD
jgi:CRISPR/Cas system-associated exonuclease Cas4 (RecB family)